MHEYHDIIFRSSLKQINHQILDTAILKSFSSRVESTIEQLNPYVFFRQRKFINWIVHIDSKPFFNYIRNEKKKKN